MENQDIIETENDIIKSFVTSTPYPSYQEMMDYLKNNIELECEYGEINHNLCKTIYENPTNEELIIEVGKKIYKRGGIQALYANYTILKYFSPYWRSTNIVIKSQGSMIGHFFQSVTEEWKA